MATVFTAVSAIHATLSTTTVDTVNLDSDPDGETTVQILNRTGTTTIYATWDRVAAATPVAAAADTLAIPAGCGNTFSVKGYGALQVKLIGSGNAYSVQVIA